MGYGWDKENMFISYITIQMMLLAVLSGDWQRFMEYGRGLQSEAARRFALIKN